MLKAFLLMFVMIFFSSCAALSYSYNSENKQLNFAFNNGLLYTAALHNPKKRAQFDACSSFSYTLNDSSSSWGDVFIEHIGLHSNCKFNAESLGLFLYEFKEQLKLQKFEKLQTLVHDNYEFRTYKINDTYFVNFIFIYTSFDYTFIVDYEGKLSQALLQQFDASFESNFLNHPRFKANYDYSLVKMNVFKGYFTKMSEDNFK